MLTAVIKFTSGDVDLRCMAADGGFERVVLQDVVSAHGAEKVCRPALLVVLLVLASAVFLGSGWRITAAPFGDSHDGRNAGVWAASARALRHDGPVASRVGTRSPENGLYANHPPLIAVEIAVTETLAGESPAASRAPAWLGSLASIWLLAALLRERGLGGPAVGVAAALTVATPMFLVFGTMLDTPVTSLPFGLGLLLVWERGRGGRRVPRPLAAGLAALAVLAGWQSLLLAGVVGAWALVRMLRHRDGDDVAFVAGALLGAVILLGWLWWAFGGSLRPLTSAYLFRTGQHGQPVPLAELLTRQVGDIRVMFGAVIVPGMLGLVVALAQRSTRGLAAVLLAVTLPYPLIFRVGAVNHEYWNYWFVLPLALGLAAGGGWALRALRDHRRVQLGLAGAACAAAGIMAMGSWLHPTAAGWAVREGIRAGTVAEQAALPAAQATAWYAGAVGQTASWISLPTARPAVHVARDDFARLVAEHPDDRVLVGRLRCRTAGAPRIDYSVESPADLVARPPEVSRCTAGRALPGATERAPVGAGRDEQLRLSTPRPRPST